MGSWEGVTVGMIYDQVAGGQELLNWFAEIPSFHDAEIVSLSLNRSSTSRLEIHTWNVIGGDFQKHVVVTFSFEKIMDLQLDGFSPQNVIHSLRLQRATDRGRDDYLAPDKDDGDIEVVMEPCYGMSGFIRAKRVVISFSPGKPPNSIY